MAAALDADQPGARGGGIGAVVDRSFQRAYANAHSPRFVRIDGSGHMVMLDQPARLQAAIRAFLQP